MASKYKINATLLLEQPDKKWLGPHGEVTKEVIQDYFPQPSDTAVILSGSIDQVHALETLLTELGYNDLILPLFS